MMKYGMIFPKDIDCEKGEYKMSKIAEAIEKKMREVNLFGEIVDDESTGCYQILKILIHWGYWKHDHLRLDWNMNELFGESIVLKNEEVVEEDGSDCYSAVHGYIIRRTEENAND